jgi:hypothetical protein
MPHSAAFARTTPPVRANTHLAPFAPRRDANNDRTLFSTDAKSDGFHNANAIARSRAWQKNNFSSCQPSGEKLRRGNEKFISTVVHGARRTFRGVAELLS